MSSDDESSGGESGFEAALADIIGAEAPDGVGPQGGPGGNVEVVDCVAIVPTRATGDLAPAPMGPSSRTGPSPATIPMPPPSIERSQAAPSVASSAQRDLVDVTAMFADGFIAYYDKGNRFHATCNQDGHFRCRLTRTSNASASRVAQGRLVGLMAAWLGHKCGPDEHRNPFLVRSFGHDARLAARRLPREVPGRDALQACERVRRADEGDSEPDEVP